MPNEKKHTLREGSRVRGLATGREGRISNPTFSQKGTPKWTVAFEPGTGTDPWASRSGPALIDEDNLMPPVHPTQRRPSHVRHPGRRGVRYRVPGRPLTQNSA